jgi:hypothetical protein
VECGPFHTDRHLDNNINIWTRGCFVSSQHGWENKSHGPSWVEKTQMDLDGLRGRGMSSLVHSELTTA